MLIYGAGFAADAGARLNGLGAVCVTYSVGGLKVTNTTAQAFAEKSPVVVISAAPGINERVVASTIALSTWVFMSGRHKSKLLIAQVDK